MIRALSVDVVIPCYRQAHFLGEAVRSCLDQAPLPVQIIVVDDGSPDDVAAAVTALNSPCVRLVRRRNGGLSAARNTGLIACSSPYVVFLDADDTLRPGALAAGLACHARHPGAAFVWGGYQNMDQHGRPYGPSVARQPRRAPLVDILVGNIIGMHGAVMYRRAPLMAAGGFDEALRTVEDWDIYLRLARDHPVAWHDTIVAHYRRHGDSLSADYDRMLKGGLTMLERFRPTVSDTPELTRAWSRGRRRFVTRNLRKALLTGFQGLGHGRLQPLLRASLTAFRHGVFLLPAMRPGFAVRAVARRVLEQTPSPVNG